jgi:hypothetical protein
MVLRRHNLLRWDQEQIGEELGLVIPEQHAAAFARDHAGPRPDSGWGTQVQKPEHSIERFISHHRLPLRFSYDPSIRPEELIAGIARNDDQLLCVESFLHPGNGHVVVLVGIDGEDVEFIDPNKGEIERMPFSRLRARSAQNMGGTWRISRTSS